MHFNFVQRVLIVLMKYLRQRMLWVNFICSLVVGLQNNVKRKVRMKCMKCRERKMLPPLSSLTFVFLPSVFPTGFQFVSLLPRSWLLPFLVVYWLSSLLVLPCQSSSLISPALLVVSFFVWFYSWWLLKEVVSIASRWCDHFEEGPSVLEGPSMGTSYGDTRSSVVQVNPIVLDKF